MNLRYRVELSQPERAELTALLSAGKHAARKLKRAQILLAADAGVSDDDIATSVGVGGSTVYRTKRRFVEGNLERALREEQRPGAERKLTGKQEALLVATACASPPEGRARWTLKLLAGAMVKLTEHKSLSHETVRRRLGENGLKPWRKDMWCIPQVNGEYVARMEDVLDLYAEAPDPKRPVVCFDESPVQLIGELRQPISAAPGQLERYDYEYRRNGTVNLFVVLDVHRPWRKVKVTERRAAEDYAQCMRELVDVLYRDAECIRVVQDNLSTHSAGALYQAFPPAEARRILRRLEFHYTPKHASWLNMVEIEIGVLRGQCLNRKSTAQNGSVAKSPPGNDSAIPNAPASNGCSQPTKPAPKWATLIPTLPKSHNHCAGVLGPANTNGGPTLSSQSGRSAWVFLHCTVILLTGPASRRIVLRTREAAMIVKNILLGRRGNVVTIEPTADLAAAVKLLAERRIGAVVILGADHRIVGILSERDIVRALAEHGSAALDEPVGQVMTRDVKTCSEDDTIESLMGRMTTGKFRHMPVEEQGKLVGIVSIGDVVKSRVEEIEREAAALRDYIQQ